MRVATNTDDRELSLEAMWHGYRASNFARQYRVEIDTGVVQALKGGVRRATSMPNGMFPSAERFRLPSKIAKPSRFTENQSFAVNLRYRGHAGAGDRPACSARCVLAARSCVRSPLPPNSQGPPPVLSVESVKRATLGPQMRTATVRN